MLMVYRCGSEVTLKNIEIKGFITGINIRDERVVYEVSYFMDGKYYQNWFCNYEIECQESNKIKVGYK